MARLQQTQRKRVGSVPRLPDDVVAAIAAEILVTCYVSYDVDVDAISGTDTDIRWACSCTSGNFLTKYYNHGQSGGDRCTIDGSHKLCYLMPLIIVGDLLIVGIYGPAVVIVVKRSTGELVWSRMIDRRPLIVITSSGAIYAGPDSTIIYDCTNVRIARKAAGALVQIYTDGTVLVTHGGVEMRQELTSDDAKGEKLDNIFRRTGTKGIVNGMDMQEWDPLTDKYTNVKYDATTVMDAKPLLKEALLAEVGFPVDSEVPVIGFIGRL
ncbi:hypothetical protein AgCh_032414 [Apium graveolens]